MKSRIARNIRVIMYSRKILNSAPADYQIIPIILTRIRIGALADIPQ